MEQKVFRYGGFEGVYNPLDADQVERTEQALEAYSQALTGLKGKRSAVLRATAKSAADLYDAVFGAGSAKAAFGAETGFEQMLSAIGELAQYIAEATQAQEAREKALVAKYAPVKAAKTSKQKGA